MTLKIIKEKYHRFRKVLEHERKLYSFLYKNFCRIGCNECYSDTVNSKHSLTKDKTYCRSIATENFGVFVIKLYSHKKIEILMTKEKM